jgi:hypothetical protein
MRTDPAPPALPELPPAPEARRRPWWTRRGRDSRRTPDRPCLNCGDPTVGFFCPTCGQKKVDVRVSLRRMLGETIEDELFLNLTLPRTVGALLFRPGRLTAEYVQGRIVRYVQPLRLYLISSVLLFVLLPWLTDLGSFGAQLEDRDRASGDSVVVSRPADAPVTAGESVIAPRVDRTPGTGVAGAAPEPGLGLRDTLAVPRLLLPVQRHLLETEARLRRMPPAEAMRTIVDGLLGNAPTGLFLMMPVFALILKGLYVRRQRFYVEHFVFALHVHAFTYLMILAMLVAPDAGPLKPLLALWLIVYVFLAMRQVYGQGVVKTFAKYVILGWSYTFVVIFGVLVTVLVTALTV